MYQGKYFENNSGVDAPDMEGINALSRRSAARAQAKAKKQANRGTVVFYSIYAGMVAVLLIAIMCVVPPLRSWLVRYEASQPEKKAQEVFDQLFADPDWASLYAQAGLADTTFEKADAFDKYMTGRAGDTQLTYLETSAGLSGDHKYVVKLGDEKIATFTLTGGTDMETEIATWELGTIELFYERTRSVTVEKLPGQTVYINGVALDESYTVRSVTTKAEEYLPDGVSGYRMEQVCVDGLLAEPLVTIKDENGNDIPVIIDTTSGVFKSQLTAPAMTDEERTIALNAALADAKYALRDISEWDLKQYFDSGSDIYYNIIHTHPFLQDYLGYSFDESVTNVYDFYRYSDDLFSARVTLLLKVTRTNGTIKEISMDKTYFLTKGSNGKYLVTQYTNVHVQEQEEQVRLTFMNGSEQVDTMMISSDAATVTLPAVTAPEGQVLQGWAVRGQDESGKTTMTIVLVPDANGIALTGQTLEPMTLYAVFAEEAEDC